MVAYPGCRTSGKGLMDGCFGYQRKTDNDEMSMTGLEPGHRRMIKTSWAFYVT